MILLIANKTLNKKSLHKIYGPSLQGTRKQSDSNAASLPHHISAVLFQENALVNVRNQTSNLEPTLGSKSMVHEGVS